MKSIQIILIFIGIVIGETGLGQSATAISVSEKISQQMTDSLGLDESQRKRLNQINLQLHLQKMEIRKQFAEVDSLQKYMQRIENTRDSLYRDTMTKEKFQIYIIRKRNIVNVKN
jgi:hypothetical protein